MTSEGSHRTSQWMKVHVPVQGTWVQSIVWEDPTCLGATKRVHQARTLSLHSEQQLWSLCAATTNAPKA